ncbi:MAG: HypD family hydrogenase formation protein, partial [Planctomycetota bacterium]
MREQMRDLTDRLADLAAGLDGTVRLMEVCGTHTVNACRSGVHALLPPGIVTYGDMIRVAGAGGSLELARSEGADVRIVPSTLEALDTARLEPDRQMVFAAVGFETTVPATAAAVLGAEYEGLENFTVLPCHKIVVPAMLTLLGDPDLRIDGFICPGHVSVIIGSDAYRPIVEQFHKPCAVTGFEALQIMQGILH